MATNPSPLPPPVSANVPGGPPPPPKKQNLVLWILGGCATVLILGTLALILAVRLFVKTHVHVASNGDVDVQLPGGGSMHTGSAKDIGVPVYPGAETNKGASVDVTVPGQQRELSTSIYSTSDPIEKVDDWYRENLDKGYERQGPGQSHISVSSRGIPVDSNAIVYVSMKGDVTTIVSLSASFGKTQINLMRVNTAPRQTQ
ncbi:MAG TPA: hypothetical protein VN774_05955 [Candidatus Limnocylindrales bacterium]|nr:hypothetical protein [Candidatus Limnocylindrales bacterium]